MKEFHTWLEEKDLKQPLPKKPKSKNAQGGFDPVTKEQIEIFKKVDLITLPVVGTNCGNCEYGENISENLMFCRHKDIQQYVNSKMCCAEWSHPDVVRKWEEKD